MEETQQANVSGRQMVSSAFPSFVADNQTDLGFLAYGGIMVGDTRKAMGM